MRSDFHKLSVTSGCYSRNQWGNSWVRGSGSFFSWYLFSRGCRCDFFNSLLLCEHLTHWTFAWIGLIETCLTSSMFAWLWRADLLYWTSVSSWSGRITVFWHKLKFRLFESVKFLNRFRRRFLHESVMFHRRWARERRWGCRSVLLRIKLFDSYSVY